jgi:hypothetical protein
LGPSLDAKLMSTIDSFIVRFLKRVSIPFVERELFERSKVTIEFCMGITWDMHSIPASVSLLCPINKCETFKFSFMISAIT